MVLGQIEIPAENHETIIQFYQGLFGWTFEKVAGSTARWIIRFGTQIQPEPITGSLVPRSAPMVAA